jgi:hypothetical protein
MVAQAVEGSVTVTGLPILANLSSEFFILYESQLYEIYMKASYMKASVAIFNLK